MKKIIIWVVVALLLIGVTLGIVFGVKACNDNNKETGDVVTVKYLENEYKMGTDIVYQISITSDVEYKTMKISMDNGAAEAVTCRTGETEDGRFYIEMSSVQVLKTSELDEETFKLGYHFFTITCTDTNNDVHEMPGMPLMFKVVSNVAA